MYCFNTFSLPARHILTLSQDPLASLFDIKGTRLAWFFDMHFSIALNKKPLTLTRKASGILLSGLNYILGNNIAIIAYMLECDFLM